MFNGIRRIVLEFTSTMIYNSVKKGNRLQFIKYSGMLCNTKNDQKNVDNKIVLDPDSFDTEILSIYYEIKKGKFN